MPTEITPNDCPMFVSYLKVLKKLTDKDVGNYLKLIGMGNINAEIVLQKTNITDLSQPYKFLIKLENAKLVLSVGTNGKKIYQVRNPRTIFEEMKLEIEGIDGEIGLLQEQFENTKFEIKVEENLNLKSEVEIEHELSMFEFNKYSIEFCIKENSKILELNRFSKYKKEKSILDFILFSNEKESGVILLDPTESGKTIRVSGTKIKSKNKYEEFKRLKNGN